MCTLETKEYCSNFNSWRCSFSRSSVVYEVIQMANLKGFKTGGTVHIVINNQVDLLQIILMRDQVHIVQM